MSPLTRQIIIRRLTSIPWHSRYLLYELAARSNSNDESWPSLALLARECGLPIETVSGALDLLTGQGLVQVRHTKGRRVLQLTLGKVLLSTPGSGTTSLQSGTTSICIKCARSLPTPTDNGLCFLCNRKQAKVQ